MIYNYMFVGFNSVPNLIVILFNLLYLVFIVGFNCKVCVIERECEDSSNWRLKSFHGYLATKHPTKWLMWLTHAGMRRVRTGWRQLCLASISRVRPSRETPARYFVLPDYQFWYTISVPTLFIPILPTNVKECFWEKNPSQTPWGLEIVISTILYTIVYGFSSTPTFPFPNHWEVDSPNTYQTISEC